MILVTGGTGLVGAHLLVQLTKREDKIRAILRKSSNLNSVQQVFSYYFDDISPYFSKIEWVEADITDINSLEPVFENVNYVYHVAAMISFHPKRYKDMRKINIEGTANIVNFSIASGVRKICYVSSVATVGRSIENQTIDESSEWNIESSNYGYAITKYGAEMEVWRGTQEGLDAVIVNPGFILGEGFWNSGSSKIFSKVHSGIKYYTEGVTGYVDVQDVVKSMIMLMDGSIKNERFILVSENLSYRAVFSEIAKSFGKKEPNIKISKFLSEISWRVVAVLSGLKGNEPLLTKHTSKSIHRVSEFSNAKIKSSIGLVFNPISSVIERVCANF
jgi:dihydroflavonol-4-reductase